MISKHGKLSRKPIASGWRQGTDPGTSDQHAPPRCGSAVRLLQQFVHHLRIGLALHRLHRLADEEAEQRFLAALILRDLVGIGGKNLGNLGFDRAGVARLLEARSEERRVGKECVSTCRSRWSPYH